jgi:hypothetical protein
MKEKKEKKKKPATELTTEEAMNELFPPEVVARLKGQAAERDAPKVKAKSSSQRDDT